MERREEVEVKDFGEEEWNGIIVKYKMWEQDRNFQEEMGWGDEDEGGQIVIRIERGGVKKDLIGPSEKGTQTLS